MPSNVPSPSDEEIERIKKELRLDRQISQQRGIPVDEVEKKYDERIRRIIQDANDSD